MAGQRGTIAGLADTCCYHTIRVMKQKLTLTVEADAVHRLKSLATRRHTSVSALLEEWSARAAATPKKQRLGQRLRARWAGTTSEGDARLEFLLGKHT